MSMRKDPKTGNVTAVVKDRMIGVVHLSLRTKNPREAARRHNALDALVRAAGDPAAGEVLRRLRARRLRIEAVTANFEAGRPWDALTARTGWPTVGQAATDFLAWLAAHPKRSPATHRMYTSRLTGDAGLVGLLGAGTSLADVTAADVERVRATLAGRGLAPQTVAQYGQVLARLYAHVQTLEMREAREQQRAARTLHSPVDPELIAERGVPRERFLTPGEARDLFAVAPPLAQLVLGLGLFAGLRVDEARMLRRMDVELGTSVIRVREKPASWLARKVWRPKTKHGTRAVPIAGPLRSLLVAHLGAQADTRPTAWLLPAPSSTPAHPRPVSVDWLQDVTRRVVTDAGLVAGRGSDDGITYHTLRHSFASWLVMAGVDLFTVARLLGHGSVELVQSTYGHISQDHRAEAIARLEGRVEIAPPPALPAGDPTTDDPPAAPAEGDA